jgi:hypothetical protein
MATIMRRSEAQRSPLGGRSFAGAILPGRPAVREQAERFAKGRRATIVLEGSIKGRGARR